MMGMQAASRPPPTNSPLPPHLREVCDILARGFLRLRSRTADDLNRDGAERGERLLHFSARQRLHANRTTRRDA